MKNRKTKKYIRKRRKIIILVLFLTTIFSAVLIGLSLGAMFAGIINNKNITARDQTQLAISSKIYDINGNLITELFSEEKREWVNLDQMPIFLIHALITKEDREFYQHGGFSVRNNLRALWNIMTGQYVSGASTITQQLAGHRYTDRTEMSISRKVIELWYALQLERDLSKDEILERYLNEMYFGHGCYGVESASQFFFGHSVKEITPAEAAMLVNQLSKPNIRSPFKDPVEARKLQKATLNDMVELGYLSAEEAEESFQYYWKNFDITRQAGSVFFLREDPAPYFTAYITQQLDEIVLGNMDIYRDGLKIYTTLNLEYQKIANQIMAEALDEVNSRFRERTSTRADLGNDIYLPMTDILSLAFNMPHIHVDDKRHLQGPIDYYVDKINPGINAISNMFGLTELNLMCKEAHKREIKISKTSEVQGALVCIDPNTGYILAMVGGREFMSEKQMNYATQSLVQPGSAFKPLFYSAAIESEKITPATILIDAAKVYPNEYGKPYVPTNYGGKYMGRVPARNALAYSLNIPAISVMEIIQFDAAIDMASSLLGITDPVDIERVFPRYWSLALGVVAISPLQMARAFATFPNKGRAVEPISIRYIKDRNNKVIFEPEREILEKNQGDSLQLMSPQTAYIMVNMLQSTVKYGTISGARIEYMEDCEEHTFAGKTGTSQNWHDAWTMGFSPQIVTAVWFGFDKGGGSLGITETGATLAAPAWAKFMNEIHKNLPVKDFERPLYGLEEVEICTKSGLLPSKYCNEDDIKKEIFLTGTAPTGECDFCEFDILRDYDTINKILNDPYYGGVSTYGGMPGFGPVTAISDSSSQYPEEQEDAQSENETVPEGSNPWLD